MGFLDRKNRVVDVVLTGRGRELFSVGKLNFAFYSFFDDEVDYDPWSSGTLTSEDRDEIIHSSPILEAHIIPDRRSSIIPLEPISFVFKAAPDYGTMPRMLSPNPTGSHAILRCDQFSSGSSFIRTGANIATVPLTLSAEAAGAEGFSVHLFISGTNGLDELHTRMDLKGRRVLDPFIGLAIDEEVPPNDSTVSRRDSIRYQPSPADRTQGASPKIIRQEDKRRGDK